MRKTTDVSFSMLKQVAYFILFFVILSAFSCTTKTVKVGMMLPNTIKERFPKERDYFIAKTKELGGETYATDAANNDELQIRQAEELIKKGVTILVVISVNKNSAAVIVRHAHEKGIKVIAYERIIANCDLDYFISFNNVKVGELLASYSTKLKPNGEYVVLSGDKSDQNAVWVRQGIMNILEPMVKSNTITIGYNVYVEEWSLDNAHQEMKNYLQLTSRVPDVVISSSDAMSLGVINVLKEFNIPKENYPVITGQNAEIQACKDILNGYQTVTVFKSLKQEAEEAATLAMKLARNETISNVTQKTFNGEKEVPSLLLDPVLVDKSNLKKIIVESGFHSEKEIYGN